MNSNNTLVFQLIPDLQFRHVPRISTSDDSARWVERLLHSNFNRTVDKLLWSLYEMCSILRYHLFSMACILLWSSALRVRDSQAYRKMDVTRERISLSWSCEKYSCHSKLVSTLSMLLLSVTTDGPQTPLKCLKNPPPPNSMIRPSNLVYCGWI